LAANTKAERNFYIVRYTSSPFTVQERTKDNGDTFEKGELVVTARYTYPSNGKKSKYYVERDDDRIERLISMKTVAVPDFDVVVWDRIRQLPQDLRTITAHELQDRRPFELTDDLYDDIKEEIARMEKIDFNVNVGQNAVNTEDAEDWNKDTVLTKIKLHISHALSYGW
jgi:hypothetical protein